MDPTSHMGKLKPTGPKSPTIQGHVLEEAELNSKPPLISLPPVICQTEVPGASLTVNSAQGNG